MKGKQMLQKAPYTTLEDHEIYRAVCVAFV